MTERGTTTFPMKESLRVSVGAVVLALATLAAVIFAWLNFVQRSRYDMVDDGVAWSDGPSGIEAWKVVPDSPASAAGIHPGDILLAIDDSPVPNASHVARRLFRAGLWTQLRYKLSRNGEEFETRLITTPPHNFFFDETATPEIYPLSLHDAVSRAAR